VYIADPDGNVIVGSNLNDLAIVSPQGELVQFKKLNGAVTQPAKSIANGDVTVRFGTTGLLTLKRLPDHWDGRPDVRATGDRKVWDLVNPVTIDIGADRLHQTLSSSGVPIRGSGVTVAVVDSGVYFDSDVKKDLSNQVQKLFVGQADFVNSICQTYQKNNREYSIGGQYPDYCWLPSSNSTDGYGHGTHVAGTICNNETDYGTGVFLGIAPEANILSVRVLENDGYGSYETVIKGIQFVVANRSTYNVRVMNLSLSAQATVPYFADPLNRAVEQAWANGVVVLAAAGNSGPGAETITVPGNDPYIITVGAINGNRTPGYWADDFVPAWSASGPTRDGFVKPDILAPGSQIVSYMYNDPSGINTQRLVQIHPDNSVTASLFRMNGTSMAPGIASGVVALMLQAHPEWTPDQVKFRLMYTARPALDDQGELAYSVLQQGAGRIWAPEAVLAEVPIGNANEGMDLNADLAHGWGHFDDAGNPVLDEAELAYHYAGPVYKVLSDDGSSYLYYMDGQDGEAIALATVSANDLLWLTPGEGLSWDSGRMIWSGGRMIWSGGRMIWSGGEMDLSGG
ncbi:MAG: S8 family peptidase, partial [Chloroflexota bacterium]